MQSLGYEVHVTGLTNLGPPSLPACYNLNFRTTLQWFIKAAAVLSLSRFSSPIDLKIMNMGQPSPGQGWSPPNSNYPPQPQGLHIPGGLPPTNQSPLPQQWSQQAATYPQRNDNNNLPTIFRDSQQQSQEAQPTGGLFNWLRGWIAPGQANAQAGKGTEGQPLREPSIPGLDPRDPLSH